VLPPALQLLQSELDSLKMARSKSQRKQLEVGVSSRVARRRPVAVLCVRRAPTAQCDHVVLPPLCGAWSLRVQLSQQLQRLRQLVSLQSRDAGAAAAAYDSPTAAGPTGKVFAQDGGAVDGGSQQQQAGAGAAAAYGVPGGSGFDNGSGSYAAGMAPGAHGDGGGSGRAEYGHVPARGWYLHACVVAAALGVRWWLLNQTDPLQRKVMLVIIWPVRGVCWCAGVLVVCWWAAGGVQWGGVGQPDRCGGVRRAAASTPCTGRRHNGAVSCPAPSPDGDTNQALWAYGALVFRCVPNSYTLRASLACTCWALLGYVAHEMVSASVRTGPGH
jgi:hypothetical protein